MIKNSYRYTKQVVKGDLFLHDTKNHYIFVSQRPYKGKSDSEGNVIIGSGVTVTLQILDDISKPVIDPTTGIAKDNNQLETFEVTIENSNYPLPFDKGDHVSLGGFIEEHSYYIKFNLIMRFKDITLFTEEAHDAD